MIRAVFLFCLLFSSLFAEKYMAIGGGVCGIVRPKDRLAMLQIEYQPEPILKPIKWFDIRPQLGIFFNTKASTYFYGGFRFEFLPYKQLLITPGFAPGIYIRGHGKRLHFPIEYKSSLEIAWIFKKNARKVSAQFYHISNGSTGFKNPGSEMLVFSYCFKI